MKNIKQIADEVGVSKQAIRNQIAKLGLQSSLQKNGNQFAINEQQETAIKQSFEKISQSENAKQTHIENDSLCVVVSVLQEQLKAKDEQLAEKDKLLTEQQQTMSKLLDRLADAQMSEQTAQLLHGGTIKTQLIGSEMTTPMGLKERVRILFTGKIS